MSLDRLLCRLDVFSDIREEAAELLEVNNIWHHGINTVYTDTGRQLNFPWGIDSDDNRNKKFAVLRDAIRAAFVRSQSGKTTRLFARFTTPNTILATFNPSNIDIVNHRLINLHNIGK